MWGVLDEGYFGVGVQPEHETLITQDWLDRAHVCASRVIPTF